MHCIPCQWHPEEPVLKLQPIATRLDCALYYLATGLLYAFVSACTLAYERCMDERTPMSTKTILAIILVFWLTGLWFTYVDHVSQLDYLDYINKYWQLLDLLPTRLNCRRGRHWSIIYV